MSADNFNAVLDKDTGSIRMLRLDDFTPLSKKPGEKDEVPQRAFETILVLREQAGRIVMSKHDSSSSGCRVFRAYNTLGTPLAIKAMTDNQKSTTARQRAFDEECRVLSVLSNVAGFPSLYGIGHIEGAPCAVMEWIEGITLSELMFSPDGVPAKTANAPRQETLVGAQAARDLILSVVRVLLGTKCLKETFLHRDLSPSNILIRTSQQPLDRQIATGLFDVVLTDMGSSRLSLNNTPTLSSHGIWRYGTVEYAAPEMLTKELPRIKELRGSETIDTYALCSILYRMLSSKPAFAVSGLDGNAASTVKLQTTPDEIFLPGTTNHQLVAIARSGLTANQKDRPNLTELVESLSNANA